MEKKPAEKNFGQFVRRIREENNWTLMDVVRQSDHKITSGYISLIELRNLKPKPDKIMALAKGLKVETELLSRYILELPTDLTPDEEYLLSTYRQLDDRGKDDLTLIAKALREKNKPHKASARPSESAVEPIAKKLKTKK